MIDNHELLALEHDLGKVAARAVPLIEAATKKAVQNIKDGLVADAQPHEKSHYPYFAASITYDRTFSSFTAIEYEVGPDKGKRQGSLGNILYFGTSRNGPVLDFEGPVKAEEPAFLKAVLEAAAGKIL